MTKSDTLEHKIKWLTLLDLPYILSHIWTWTLMHHLYFVLLDGDST